VVENYLEVGLYDDYEHYWITTHDDVSSISKILIFVRAIFSLLTKVRKRPILHIHVSSGASLIRKAILIKIGNAFGCKTIFHLHGSEFREFYSGSSPLIQKVVRNALDSSSVIIVLSQSWKQFIASICQNSNIYVINNFVRGIDVDESVKNREIVTLLFMGRLGTRKGAYDIVEAMRLARNELPDCKLYFCGDGELDQVREKIEDAALGDICKIEGWIGPNDKSRYYSMADIFLLPSHNEGLPMSILEAMSAKLAIVTSPVGGIPEAIVSGENGFLVEPGDVLALSETIKQLANDRELRIKVGMAASESFGEKFCPEAIVPRLHDIYKKLADGSLT
jgi:glycosyltransferase involved in cell wall biosynthesis